MLRRSSLVFAGTLSLGLLLGACGGEADTATSPTSSASTTSAASASPSATAMAPSTAAVESANSAAPTQEPAAVDPAQSDLDLLKGTDWMNTPIINLSGDEGERATLAQTAGGTTYLGTSYNIVAGKARALVVYADQRGFEYPTAILGLYGIENGQPVQLAAGDMEDLEGASTSESFYVVHAAFEETPDGVVVYANAQGQGVQGPYQKYRVRMIEGGGEMYGFNGEDGSSINWLNAGPTEETLASATVLEGLPPTENVVTFSPYASDLKQALPSLDAASGEWE